MNVQVGKVSSVNTANGSARVTFADIKDAAGKPYISAPLKVIKQIPKVTSDSDADESAEFKVEPWLPEVGELVLCLYLPHGEGDGFVLGGI